MEGQLEAYNRLYNLISELVKDGKISEVSLPDDSLAVVDAIQRCKAANRAARAAIAKARNG